MLDKSVRFAAEHRSKLEDVEAAINTFAAAPVADSAVSATLCLGTSLRPLPPLSLSLSLSFSRSLCRP
jgi:hypothetical protein